MVPPIHSIPPYPSHFLTTSPVAPAVPLEQKQACGGVTVVYSAMMLYSALIAWVYRGSAAEGYFGIACLLSLVVLYRL